MKITKPRPKCAGCGHWAVIVYCQSALVNGCETSWCVLCWPDHAQMHQEQWDKDHPE